MFIQKIRTANIKYYPQRIFHAPDWIILGVNNLCNLHCKMCDVGTQYQNSNFYYNLMGSRPLNMPLELIQLIIEQTAHYFPSSKLGYAFTEPLIYPHLIESLELAGDRGLFTSVTTNALTLEKKAQDLAEAGLNELYISLDGPPEIHNFIRGNRRSFEKAFEGIEKTVALPSRKPSVSVFCTITEWNIGHLVEFLELFQDLPLKQLGFMHTNFTPTDVAEAHNRLYGDLYSATDSSVEGISIESMNLELLLEEVLQIKRMDLPFPVTFSPELETRESLEIFYHQPDKLIGRICNNAFQTLMIKSDGSAIPAHGRCYNVNVGNIYQQSLKEIWNSSPLAQFRKTLMDAGGLLPACSRCCSAF